MTNDQKTFYETTSSKGTYVGVRNSDRQCYRDLDELFDKLKIRGWLIQTDPDTLKDYPSIAKDYFQGTLGDLKFKSKRYPAGFEIEFYQDINFENRFGGKYDFNKLSKMPYLIKLKFLKELKFIKEFLIHMKYEDKSEPSFNNSFDEIMYRIKKCWHYKEGKEKPEYDIPAYNGTDKYKKRLRNGQVKYFRNYKGNLMRGTIYHNINNMWWIIINKSQYTNVAAFHLFDIEDEPYFERKVYSRKIPHRIRAEKIRKLFNEKYTYQMLNESHISHLRLLVSNELIGHNEEMSMSVNAPRKKDTNVLKTKGLKSAYIGVRGSYFSDREGITFSQTGFIGFAGWASEYNVKPFVDAFEK